MRRPQLEGIYSFSAVLQSPDSTNKKRKAALEPDTRPPEPGMPRKKPNVVRTGHSAQVLLSFGFDVWENIATHLSPQECEAFAATCR